MDEGSSTLRRLARLLLAAGVLAVVHAALPVEARQNRADPPGVQSLPDEGRTHLRPGQKWSYKSSPPTSGPHDPSPAAPGFYDSAQAPEKLVHALEHGNVILYYERPSPRVLEELEELAARYRGPWDGVIVTPLAGLGEEDVLTAWTKMLRLESFDSKRAAAFLEAFRGRGPEYPVR